MLQNIINIASLTESVCISWSDCIVSL